MSTSVVGQHWFAISLQFANNPSFSEMGSSSSPDPLNTMAEHFSPLNGTSIDDSLWQESGEAVTDKRRTRSWSVSATSATPRDEQPPAIRPHQLS
ncbi:hypothetical protein CEXT_18781 [Caerostris extrusa]|uniref:Uncharacterized protein n=1 Tax=Caerostris extrusa TaxID=172846 RepID=A0AAV4Y459_CAEEX|nr:hypothetical protein CEXT_18781 [Caerostris extrusa]